MHVLSTVVLTFPAWPPSLAHTAYYTYTSPGQLEVMAPESAANGEILMVCGSSYIGSSYHC